MVHIQVHSMSVDLPSQQACVGIAGDSAGIQRSGRKGRAIDVSGISGYGFLTNLMASPMKRASALFLS